MAIQSYKDADGNCHWPSANLNSEKYYGVDWADYLTDENDTYSSVSWTVPTGLTSMDESVVSGETRIKLSADSVGSYEVVCTMNSAEGGETQKHIQKMNLEVV